MYHRRDERLCNGPAGLAWYRRCLALPVRGQCSSVSAFLIPLFFLWSTLQLTNTRFGLIVIYWAIFSPLATLLLRSYLVQLPRDFEDAAA